MGQNKRFFQINLYNTYMTASFNLLFREANKGKPVIAALFDVIKASDQDPH